jgi:hypothetical protein
MTSTIIAAPITETTRLYRLNLGFPPDTQELRGQNIGRVIVNSTLDRPWSNISAACLRAIGHLSGIARPQQRR